MSNAQNSPNPALPRKSKSFRMILMFGRHIILPLRPSQIYMLEPASRIFALLSAHANCVRYDVSMAEPVVV